MASKCPHHALLSAGSKLSGDHKARSQGAHRCGKVEGKQVADLILDTGCSQTMVRRELVPEVKKLEGEAVMVRCAHGDIVLYS